MDLGREVEALYGPSFSKGTGGYVVVYGLFFVFLAIMAILHMVFVIIVCVVFTHVLFVVVVETLCNGECRSTQPGICLSWRLSYEYQSCACIILVSFPTDWNNSFRMP